MADAEASSASPVRMSLEGEKVETLTRLLASLHEQLEERDEACKRAERAHSRVEDELRRVRRQMNDELAKRSDKMHDVAMAASVQALSMFDDPASHMAAAAAAGRRAAVERVVLCVELRGLEQERYAR